MHRMAKDSRRGKLKTYLSQENFPKLIQIQLIPNELPRGEKKESPGHITLVVGEACSCVCIRMCVLVCECVCVCVGMKARAAQRWERFRKD